MTICHVMANAHPNIAAPALAWYYVDFYLPRELTAETIIPNLLGRILQKKPLFNKSNDHG
jgi:hypothetical protein